MDLRELGGIYLRGLAMGAADAVPGVSGGTIALITGIYERLISAITAVDPDRLQRVAAGIRSNHRPDAVAALRELDIGFLVALGAGILTAVVTILRLVSTLLATNPVGTYGFFFGLIGASAVVLYSEVAVATRGRKAAALAGFVFAFAVSGVAAGTIGSPLPLVFLAGAVAVTAMVLPGVSGSLLLVMLGQYEYMSTTLSVFTDGLVAAARGDGTAALSETAPTISVFLAGGVVGLFTVAHAVRWALDHYREATLAFLVSLIVGALRAPVEQTEIALSEAGQAWTPTVIAVFGVVAIAGAAVVVGIDRLAGGIAVTDQS